MTDVTDGMRASVNPFTSSDEFTKLQFENQSISCVCDMSIRQTMVPAEDSSKQNKC